MSTIDYEELSASFYRLNKLFRRLAHHVPREFGLHRGQATLLAVLLQNDGVSQRELAELLDLRPSTLTEMLARLEQQGWVSRKPAENDQRVLLVSLTPAGRDAASAVPDRDEFSRQAFSCLTEEEAGQLKAIADKLSAHLESTLGEDEYPGCHRGHHRFGDEDWRHGSPHDRRGHHGWGHDGCRRG